MTVKKEQAKALLSAIGDLDERLLLEADQVTVKKTKRWLVPAVAAACFAVAVYGGNRLWNRYMKQGVNESLIVRQEPGSEQQAQTPDTKPQTPGDGGQLQNPAVDSRTQTPAGIEQQQAQNQELPKLTARISAGGLGFEGVWVGDAMELIDESPWRSDWQLQSLPVWINQAEEVVQPPFSTQLQERMRETARTLLSRLQAESADARRQLAAWDGQSSLLIELADKSIHVYPDRQVSILFHQEQAFPTAVTQLSDPIEQMRAIGDYVLRQYGDWLGMQGAKAAISGGDLQADGSRLYQLKLYDGGGTQAQQLTRYELGSATFGVSDRGLSVIHLQNLPDEEDLVGEYPLLTEAKAREQLLAGRYLTVGFEPEQPRSDTIEQVKLVYHAAPDEPYVMPYYRYLVRQESQMGADGSKLLAAYYVPAVEEVYLME